MTFLFSPLGRQFGMAFAVLALVGGIWWHGRLHERAVWRAAQAELRAERQVQAARIVGLTEALVAAQAERDALVRRLEEDAHADDDADRPALGPDSVRRLNRR